VLGNRAQIITRRRPKERSQIRADRLAVVSTELHAVQLEAVSDAPVLRLGLGEFSKLVAFRSGLARRAFRPKRLSVDDEIDGVDGTVVVHRSDQIGVWIGLNLPRLVRQALVNVESINSEVPVRPLV